MDTVTATAAAEETAIATTVIIAEAGTVTTTDRTIREVAATAMAIPITEGDPIPSLPIHPAHLLLPAGGDHLRPATTAVDEADRPLPNDLATAPAPFHHTVDANAQRPMTAGDRLRHLIEMATRTGVGEMATETETGRTAIA